MLGFNKYVIPFQQKGYELPFNLYGVDTIIYEPRSFKEMVAKAIDQAILETKQESSIVPDVNQDVGAYLLLKNALVVAVDTLGGDRDLFRLGQVCVFNLCTDLEGMRYIFFGNFANLRPGAIAWRIQKLVEIWKARVAASEHKLQVGCIATAQRDALLRIANDLQIWILTNTDGDRQELEGLLNIEKARLALTIFTSAEVAAAVSSLGMY